MKHRRCAVAFCHFTNKNALQGHLKTQQQERKYETYGKEKKMDGSSPVPGHAGDSGCTIYSKCSNREIHREESSSPGSGTWRL